MHKTSVGLELFERISRVSVGNEKEADYSDFKSSSGVDNGRGNDEGVLREGGAPVYTSPEVLALLAQYVTVGLMYGALPLVPYNVLVSYFHVTGVRYSSARALISLGWSLKVFVGIVSDCYPMFGYRRKSYMVLGWLLCGSCMLVLGFLPHGGPGNPKLSKTDPYNVDAQSRATTIGLLCALATFAYIIADVPADALVVEYAQREPEHVRGRMQSLIYATRTVTSTLSIALMGFGLNSADYGGSFNADIGLNTVFLILTVPCFLNVFVTHVYIQDKCHDGVNFRVYLRQFWDLAQKRAVWTIMLFNFFFNLFGSNITTTAAPYVQSVWANVDNVNNSVMSALGALIFAAILGVMGRWGTTWNWRFWIVLSTLSAVAIDAVVQYLTIYNYLRNQWFYLGVPITEYIPQGVLFIITTFAIVELAEEGNEGIIYGLLTTVTNLPSVFGTMVTNMYCERFQVGEGDIKSDTSQVRNDVATTYVVYYSSAVFACLFVFLSPTQKKMLQEWKQNGTKHPWVGGSVLVGAFSILCVSVTANIMTMFESTKCYHIAGGHGCTP
ncbi:hypothetical protein DYB35_011497 [Aphanomyces astaci]|uniref:Folate-Biopterin Transporter (FBT) Family n=1 Tax=Aphanomyces astaci TaxID=112090 RepID=A0A3R7E5Z4_APHAT|nr:hypothetical protein DYB35_011497 [Aphanomyces astaci]